jgi:hemolysin III
MTAGEAFEASAKAVSRQLTRWEIGVDGAIHCAAIIAAIIGGTVLLVLVSGQGALDIVAVSIYSGGLLAMLICSAAYNFGGRGRRRSWLRNLDQAAIFLMIAGTYTPFTVLHLDGAWRVSLTTIIWSIAGCGILLRILHGRLFDRLAIAFYLSLGWMALVAVAPLVRALDAPVLVIGLLAAGGLLYTIGVIFHLWERLPFQNAIWHGFVVAAAAFHFAAVIISVLASSGPV